jgi:colanic acid/amylovoran biosynthesis glycosyltransferase
MSQPEALGRHPATRNAACGSGTTAQVAYLVNQYPKVSHTFIRREIRALESHGVQVARFSVRPTPDRVVDEADRTEVANTRVLLEKGSIGLAVAMLRHVVARPRLLLHAAWLAVKLGWRSDRGLARHFAYLGEACLLRRLLEGTGVQHVHAHFGTNPAAVAMLCHALGGPKYSFTVHGPDEFDMPLFLGLREKISRAAFVVAISSYGRSQLMRFSHWQDWTKIRLVRCGLDEDYLAREPLPVPDVPRLVCVGRLSAQKGHLLLLDAAAQLRRAGNDFELVLAGDGEMRQEIETAIRRHDLGGRVRITGWLDDRGIRGELESARALVLPSFAEGLPVVIMEALAMGRPVVGTYVAGIPELVVPSENGWLVPAGSVEALVDALGAVLRTSPDQLTRMGLKGRERVRELHNVRVNACELMACVESS